jgi:hypothetical protein
VTTSAPTPPPLPDPQLAYDGARDQLAFQLAAVDSIVAKGGVFLGVGSTLMGIGVAVLALKPGFPWAAWLALAGTGVTYITMTVSSVRLFGRENWLDGPNVRELARDLYLRSEAEVKWRATLTLLRQRERNQAPYKRRLRMLRLAAWCLVLETMALLALGLIVART